MIGRPESRAAPGGHALAVCERVLVVVVGGYLLVAGMAALGARLAALWMAPSEAVLLCSLLAFIAYPAVLLTGFANTSRAFTRWAIGLPGAGVFGASLLLA